MQSLGGGMKPLGAKKAKKKKFVLPGTKAAEAQAHEERLAAEAAEHARQAAERSQEEEQASLGWGSGVNPLQAGYAERKVRERALPVRAQRAPTDTHSAEMRPLFKSEAHPLARRPTTGGSQRGAGRSAGTRMKRTIRRSPRAQIASRAGSAAGRRRAKILTTKVCTLQDKQTRQPPPPSVRRAPRVGARRVPRICQCAATGVRTRARAGRAARAAGAAAGLRFRRSGQQTLAAGRREAPRRSAGMPPSAEAQSAGASLRIALEGCCRVPQR